MFAATTTSRVFAVRALRHATFSTDCAAAVKLRNIFEEYRQQHYAQETPYRFKKEMVNAAQRVGATTGDCVKVDALNQILVNIGRSEDCLTDEELNAILVAADAHDRDLPVEKLLQLM